MGNRVLSFIGLAKEYALAHKLISLVALAAIAGGGYYAYAQYSADDGETRYVLANAERGTIVATVSGSGQVSASSQVDVQAKTAGDLVALSAAVGQTVTAGAQLAQIDATDAAYDLETARLSYDELVTIDPDEVRAAEDALEDAQGNLADAYVSARGTLAAAATDMDTVISSLDDLYATNGYLYASNRTDLVRADRDALNAARDKWFAADSALTKFLALYKTVTAETDNATISSTLSSANATAQAVAEAAKAAKDVVTTLREAKKSSGADEAYTEVTTLVTTANATFADTQNAVNTLANSARALRTAEDDLADVQQGPDELDIRSEELSVRQKQQAYADHFVRAPFDGVIAAVPVRRGQSVSSGATIATMITKQKIAEVSLNEVDAAKIQTGQKATLTFDAIDGLSISGQVLEVDLIGTVSQGVVNYTVKIGFDTDDERIKPGMTVNSAIIVEAKPDVLVVPSSAVKTQSGASYVQAFQPALTEAGGSQGITTSRTPVQIPVEIGLSDDTNVEILSGLSEGQQIVARTLTGTTQTTTSGGGFGGPPVRF